LCERVLDIAAADEIGFGVKTVLGDGVFDFQDGRQRLVFDDDFLLGGAAGFLGFADDEGDDLAVIKHLFVSEQNFVVTNRADVVGAGHIFGEQDGGDVGMVLAAEASRRRIFARA